MAQFRTVCQLASQPPASGSGPVLDGGCYLHYNGPGSSGYGVKRTAMLLPQSAMLMVSPMGCGRSGSVVAQRFGFAHRMFYLNLDEYSLASGSYLKKMEDAVQWIADTGEFQAILVCMTCIDAMTGTDLAGICARLSRRVGLPIPSTFMDPIVRDGNFGPMVQVRQAITSCFQAGPVQPYALNLLGTFAPLPPQSELARLVKAAGISEIRTVAGCPDFDALEQMGRSRGNLIIHPQAVACGNDLKKRLNMPFVTGLTAYTPHRIRENYRALEQFLGVPLDWAQEEQQLEEQLGAFAQNHPGLRVAVGDAVCGSPFDIACLLLRAGVSVPFLFRDRILPSDRPALLELAQLVPDLPVYSGVHPSTWARPGDLPQADVALGLDAGYFLPQAVSVGWPWEESHYGFEAARHLLTLIEQGLAAPQGHRAQMNGTYLTV